VSDNFKIDFSMNFRTGEREPNQQTSTAAGFSAVSEHHQHGPDGVLGMIGRNPHAHAGTDCDSIRAVTH